MAESFKQKPATSVFSRSQKRWTGGATCVGARLEVDSKINCLKTVSVYALEALENSLPDTHRYRNEEV